MYGCLMFDQAYAPMPQASFRSVNVFRNLCPDAHLFKHVLSIWSSVAGVLFVLLLAFVSDWFNEAYAQMPQAFSVC